MPSSDRRHPILIKVTERVKARSQVTREAYLAKLARQRDGKPYRQQLACANLAHAYAAADVAQKKLLSETNQSNLAIVSAYNDMLSAHQPYGAYPEIIKRYATQFGASAQVAGGVPAMCDGVTQGFAGMELSLFSRDLIAQATAIALSHQVFDGAFFLGICDKIVPGLLIGALAFGHLPAVFIPAGPMPSGISNKQKARVRQDFVQGKVDQTALLRSESQAYHSPGTCTFYGTANSNQMLMEIMGLQLPGSSFENPTSPLREPLTAAAVKQLLATIVDKPAKGIGEILSAETLLNGVVGLLASGGSSNHTIHLIAIARAAGWLLDWQDMAELSLIVPLLCRVYPNGEADINQFHHAGGMAYLIGELLDNGLLHDQVDTVMGHGLRHYCLVPKLEGGDLIPTQGDADTRIRTSPRAAPLRWVKPGTQSHNEILRPLNDPFAASGGLSLLQGNLGRAIIKTSALTDPTLTICAPAKVFDSQQALTQAFADGELEQDFIAVVRFQGPKANGMPELHKLTPILGSLQDRGFKVALVTDGRMSGASGKVPAAIHLTPEALDGGPIARLHNGDLLRLDCATQQLEVLLSAETLATRPVASKPDFDDQEGIGRELFAPFRRLVGPADQGACLFNYEPMKHLTPSGSHEYCYD